MSHDEFEWPCVHAAIPGQQPIAVYTNEYGEIVIRQDGDYYRSGDGVIIVRPENARRLVAAIMALATPEDPGMPLALPAPMTPAERQRRYRHAKRNADRDDGVTASVTRRHAADTQEQAASD